MKKELNVTYTSTEHTNDAAIVAAVEHLLNAFGATAVTIGVLTKEVPVPPKKNDNRRDVSVALVRDDNWQSAACRTIIYLKSRDPVIVSNATDLTWRPGGGTYTHLCFYDDKAGIIGYHQLNRTGTRAAVDLVDGQIFTIKGHELVLPRAFLEVLALQP